MEVMLYASNDAELTRALLIGKVVPSPAGGQTYTGFVPVVHSAAAAVAAVAASVAPVPVAASAKAGTDEEDSE